MHRLRMKGPSEAFSNANRKGKKRLGERRGSERQNRLVTILAIQSTSREGGRIGSSKTLIGTKKTTIRKESRSPKRSRNIKTKHNRRSPARAAQAILLPRNQDIAEGRDKRVGVH